MYGKSSSALKLHDSTFLLQFIMLLFIEEQAESFRICSKPRFSKVQLQLNSNISFWKWGHAKSGLRAHYGMGKSVVEPKNAPVCYCSRAILLIAVK